MSRMLFVRLHRWLGLGTAVFLFIAGCTGALIAWEHELDGTFNPELYYVAGVPRDVVELPSEHEHVLSLLDKFEQTEPQVSVAYAPLSIEAGHTLQLAVVARPDAAGLSGTLPFDEVALRPDNGALLASRMRSSDLMPFLYRLHYSLHLPDTSAGNVGVLLMGLIAIAWLIDCWVALSISFPNPRTWYKSLRYRLSSGPRFTFDLHRSSGVWLFGILLLFAVTAVSMNLERQVVRPLVALVSELGPDAFDGSRLATAKPSPPAVSRKDAVKHALDAARGAGVAGRPGGIFYSSLHGVYGVGFFEPGFSHGDGGLGNPWFYIDANSGELISATIPGKGSFGDLFLQAQFPLHSGRVLGVPGRILVSLLGVAIGVLSITGVMLWARRVRAARRPVSHKSAHFSAGAPSDFHANSNTSET